MLALGAQERQATAGSRSSRIAGRQRG